MLRTEKADVNKTQQLLRYWPQKYTWDFQVWVFSITAAYGSVCQWKGILLLFIVPSNSDQWQLAYLNYNFRTKYFSQWFIHSGLSSASRDSIDYAYHASGRYSGIFKQIS
jgi:hypothetical protein